MRAGGFGWALLAAGCSLSGLTESDDPDAGSNPGSAGDSSVNGTGGSQFDAGSGGAGGAAGFGGTGGSSECGGRGANFCNGNQPAKGICLDFDSTTLQSLGGKVDNDGIKGGKQVATANAEGCNQTDGGKMEVGSDGCAYSRLDLSWKEAFQTATFEADIFVPTSIQEGRVRVGTIGLPGDCNFLMTVRPNSDDIIHVQTSSINDDTNLLVDMPIGQWFALKMTLENDNGKPRFSATVDGTVALPATTFDQCSWQSEGRATIGLWCQNEPNTLRVDNWRVEYQ